MKVTLSKAFDFAHDGFRVVSYAAGDQVDENSDVGQFAIQDGMVRRKRRKAPAASDDGEGGTTHATDGDELQDIEDVDADELQDAEDGDVDTVPENKDAGAAPENKSAQDA